MNKIKKTWRDLLKFEFSKPYMKKISYFLKNEIFKKKTIYPEKNNIFKALILIPFKKIKVIILGQDPYYLPKKATGLAFSIPKNESLTETLINIFKELKNNYPDIKNKTGCLNNWVKQGVFLLNCILTVEAYKPRSHQLIGWENFTNEIIKTLSLHRKNLVFILLGQYAQTKENLIDKKKHLILKTSHPSPLSAHKGFFGSKIFLKTNEYLKKIKKKEINWNT